MNYKRKKSTDPLIIVLYLFTISIPFFGYSFININNTPILRFDWLFAGILSILFVLTIFIRKINLKITPISYGVIMLNIIALLSLINLLNKDIDNIYSFLTKWLQLLLMSALFISFSSLKLKNSQLRKIIKLWLVVAFIISLYGIYQAIARNYGLPLAYLPIFNPTIGTLTRAGTFGDYVRPSSVFGEPSWFGSYLIGPLIVVSIIMTNKKAEKKFLFNNSVVNWIILLVLTLTFLMIFSLAAYATISLILITFLFYRKTRVVALKIISVFIVLLSVLSILSMFTGLKYIDTFERTGRISSSILEGDITQLSGTSAGVRLARGENFLKIGADHPILGVGLANPQFYANQYSPPEWYKGQPTLGRNHNMWISTFAEMGIFGLFSLIFLYAITLLYTRKALKFAKENSTKIFLLAIYFVIISDIINSQFTYEMIHPQRWFTLSLASLVYFKVKSEEGW